MRDVFERLERLRVAYYLTGSEALGAYGQPRQTMDIDIVLDVGPSDIEPVLKAFEADHVIGEAVNFSGHWMASLIPTSGLGKVDLILRREDPWGRSSMERRRRWEHPAYGPIWVISLEDLVLAKLEWSGGTSELQLRDVRNLMATNGDRMDWVYLERFAATLRVAGLLQQVHDAT
jgi:hypothetical protein